MNTELDGLSLPLEQWRPVEGYEDLYSVSNLGRVYSHKSHRYLRPRKNKGGYLLVNLHKDKKMKTMKVHRLVLSAFSPRDDSNALDVNHRNGKKDDNRLTNLEWSTRSENQRHSVYVLGNDNGHARKAIAQFSRDGIRLNVFRSISEAERTTGVNHSNICNCAKGYRRQAGGYIWQYLSDLPEEEAA